MTLSTATIGITAFSITTRSTATLSIKLPNTTIPSIIALRITILRITILRMKILKKIKLSTTLHRIMTLGFMPLSQIPSCQYNSKNEHFAKAKLTVS